MSAITTECLQLINGEDGFLPSELARRNVGERFTPDEKHLLANALRCRWREMSFNRQEAPILDIASNFQWGVYQDGELYVLSSRKGREAAENLKGSHLYTCMKFERPDDVVVFNTMMDNIGGGSVVVATMYFPCARGDRPEYRNGDTGLQEMLVVETLMRDIKSRKVGGLVTIEGHSPVLSWLALKHGISNLDLSALPALCETAIFSGFLDGVPLLAVGADDGASEMGFFVKELLGAEDAIYGNKKKLNRQTIVTYSEEGLAKIPGKMLVVGEDIIGTGRTMRSSFDVFFNHGAKGVVVLVDFPIFAGNALELLGVDDRIKIVTTDGRTPMADIGQCRNIVQVPMFERLSQVLDLDKAGVDFWSPAGQQALLALGLSLSPWQIYNLQEPFSH
jgi:phosphoribosylpyrophosphate synthetase